MKPKLHWRGFAIRTYPLMLYLGLVAGTVSGNLAARALGLDARSVLAATLLLIAPALAAARLLYVAVHWRRHYNQNRDRVWDRRDGGMAMYGGLPAMLALSVPVAAALGLRLGSFWDAALFTILTGIAFTKVGCLLNGCCAGRPSSLPFAMRLPDAHGRWVRRIPVQLFEAAWALAVCLAAAWWLSATAPAYPGALFLAGAAAYSAGRIVWEQWREPESGPAGRIRLGTAFSAAVLVAAAAAHWCLTLR